MRVAGVDTVGRPGFASGSSVTAPTARHQKERTRQESQTEKEQTSMDLLIPKKWVHECVWSRREVATGNYSGNFNAEEDDRERESRSHQKLYRAKLWSRRGCSGYESWCERCWNDLKTAAGAAVFVAIRCTIVMCAAESDMLRGRAVLFSSTPGISVRLRSRSSGRIATVMPQASANWAASR